MVNDINVVKKENKVLIGLPKKINHPTQYGFNVHSVRRSFKEIEPA